MGEAVVGLGVLAYEGEGRKGWSTWIRTFKEADM
jgi:hypothetical protein